MSEFTPTQGRYLAFIHAYTAVHRYPPSELEIAAAMIVSPPSVNQMVKMLEKRGLISRQPGRPRSLRVIIPEEEIPAWGTQKAATKKAITTKVVTKKAASKQRTTLADSSTSPATLYCFRVFLAGGPMSTKFQSKVISRDIEIRGDQTLADLHESIFEAYDRFDAHMYQFQFGKGPHDPAGPNYGIVCPGDNTRDASRTTIDSLGLKPDKVFGYWFDFGDDWFHQIQIERIDTAIPSVTYPRITKRVGKSPPQYLDEE